MTISFIDISNWQAGFDPAAAPVDGVVVKATEGLNYVDPYCDNFYQSAKAACKLLGFYHFAGSGDPLAEAAFFYQNTKGYLHEAIPILDWEGDQSVEWVNKFVSKFNNISGGIWPWIYANPWRFNQGGVESNCARWIASYPNVTAPTFDDAQGWDCPEADGNVVAWQFCSDGPVNGWNVDCSLYYGDTASWNKYAGREEPSPACPGINRSDIDTPGYYLTGAITLANDDIKVTIESNKNG